MGVLLIFLFDHGDTFEGEIRTYLRADAEDGEVSA